MKRNIKIFFKSIVFTSFMLLFFIGFGYTILTSEITLVETKKENVPYYEQIPQNANVLFSVSDSHTLLCLDFEKKNMRVLNVEEINETYLFSGYQTDFYIECDFETLSKIIDCVNGIDLETEEGTRNFTGIQIIEMLQLNDDGNFKLEIKKSIIEKISKNGLSKDDFLVIIKNTNTNLTISECYDWGKYIGTLCKNVIFVN